MGHPDNGGLLSISFFLLILPILARSSMEKALRVDPSKVTQLSWHPRIFAYKGFIKPEECDHLINLARGKLEKSMVVDEKGQAVEAEERTSSGMFLRRAEDETVASIEARIAAWTMIPAENGEWIQILRYEKGQKYAPHYDYFEGKALEVKRDGHRAATVLMYLSDVGKGGETVFPYSDEVQVKDDGSWSDCSKVGFAFKPRKGDALLFFSLRPDATIDRASLHGSCPVEDGEKWSATKWIHTLST